MGRRKRRKFTAEYKAEVVGLVRSSGKSVGQVAQELDLTETAVRAWVRQATIDGRPSPQGPLTSEERAELTRLRREMKTVTMERDFLRKAAVGSTGRCNSTGDSKPRRQKSKCLAWAAVKPQSDHVEIMLAVG